MQTIYDFNNVTFSYTELIILSIFLLAWCFLPWREYKRHNWTTINEWKKPGVFIFLLLSNAVALTVFISAWYINVNGFLKLKSVYEEKSYSIIEGQVSKFWGGSKLEGFSVGRKDFSYSKHKANHGYNLLCSQGGLIRNGVKIRLWYFNDSILYISVAENTQLKINKHNNIRNKVSRFDSRKIKKCNLHIDQEFG